MGLLDNEIIAWRAGKKALVSGDKEKAWQLFKEVFESSQFFMLPERTKQEFLADVLSLGNFGREEILRRRNALESLIESGDEYSDEDWQVFNEALEDHDRDIQMLDRLKGSDFSKLRARSAVLTSIVNRLGALGDCHAVAPYLELFVSNLNDWQMARYEGTLVIKEWSSIVEDGIRCIHAALLANCVQMVPRIADCLIHLSPPVQKLCTLLEIDGLSAKDPVLKDFIKMKVEELPKIVQLKFWLATYLADEDYEGFVGGPELDERGAPRDEYMPEAEALIPLLEQDMSQEQFRTAFGAECSVKTKMSCTKIIISISLHHAFIQRCNHY